MPEVPLSAGVALESHLSRLSFEGILLQLQTSGTHPCAWAVFYFFIFIQFLR